MSLRTVERSECRSSSYKHISIFPFASYLPLLLDLASKKSKLEEGTVLRMKGSKILLGSRRVKGGGGGGATIGGDKDGLLHPHEVVIVDDTNAYQLFGDRIFCAPQVDAIEGTQSNAFGLLCVTYCN
jgi:hypothetical protein